MKLSIVIAAYNERENVEELTRRLLAVLVILPVSTWELIYVVEGKDGTREVLEELKKEIPQLRLIYRAEPSGLGNAFRVGFDAVAADTDVIVTMDADLNHQPEEIPRLLQALRDTNSDIVVGSRFIDGSSVEGTPLWKRFLSGVMNIVMRFMFSLRTKDKTSGFRVYRAPALRTLSHRNTNFAFLPELLILAYARNYRIHEEPITFIYRTRGVSKMHFLQTSVSYLGLLRSRFRRQDSPSGSRP